MAVGWSNRRKELDMKKTTKTASVKEPHNYWINRRIYADENGKEYIKINGMFFAIDWLILKGWDVNIYF